MKKLEFLMPAGNLEKLKYAFAYGADAVYAGVPMFSLRARENQFSRETLEEAVEYTHNLGKKIYFTANIYAHNAKIKPFMEAFKKMETLKPDAYIMSDPGLINMVRKEYPNAEIHLSVQANNTNWAQVKFWQEIGIKRVILSREISLREIKEIHENCPEMELEFFIHGAICMAYSGRCLLSNYMAHRDPNQGTCAHSCRWEYKVYKNDIEGNDLYENTGRPEDYTELKGEFYLEEKERQGNLLPIDEDEFGTYIMNSRDMCLLDYIEELRDAGIVSFKVEGRSKTINYIAGVGRAYRQAIDAVEAGEKYNTKELINELFAISNRGYIPGFITGDVGASSIYYEKNSELKEEDFVGIIREYDENNKLALIEVKNRIDLGQTLRLISLNKSFEFKLEKIIDMKGENKTEAHGGSFNVWINMSDNPGEFALLRKNYINLI
ncbi:MAG: U32 family peptidase C-terminal domain-containing protein [Candidatus Gracilibacteria bacterium]|nr:U32 family peptidase C-terminal domain-containing protein [Candidatus Gracilibacteria bacterium]MDD2908250.1 U32 family peptidase C-terminal domain-containing protein [Candidatus Gracilibacteria bacterium]